MKLKVGDKLLCKKNHIPLQFSKENEYEIIYFDDNYIMLLSNLNGTSIGRNDEIVVNKQKIYFARKNNNLVNHTVGYVWEYFYTEKEIRKKKLGKLRWKKLI